MKDKIPIFTCPECGKNLFEVGVTEHTNNADISTSLIFEPGKLITGETIVESNTTRMIRCNHCHSDLNMDSDYLLNVFEGQKTEKEVKILCKMIDKPIYECPHCKVNIFKKGFIEITIGGLSECHVTFDEGGADYGETCINNPSEQYIRCAACETDIQVAQEWLVSFYDGSCTLDEIIDECGPDSNTL